MTSKLALALPQLQRLQCHQVTQLDALITIAIMMMMPLTMAIENLNLFRRKVGTRTRRHEVEDPKQVVRRSDPPRTSGRCRMCSWSRISKIRSQCYKTFFGGNLENLDFSLSRDNNYKIK